MKIHHIAYLVKNLKKSEGQFALLGFEVEESAAYDALRDVNISFWSRDGYRIELVEPASKTSPMYPLLERFKNAPYHICYETEDLEAETERLQEQHFAVIRPAEEAPCLGGRRVVFLQSSAAGMIELLEQGD